MCFDFSKYAHWYEINDQKFLRNKIKAMKVWCGNHRTKKTLPTEISKGGNILLKEQCVTCFFYFEAMPKMRQIFIILYLIQWVETGKPTDKRNDNKIGYFVMLDPPYLFFKIF